MSRHTVDLPYILGLAATSTNPRFWSQQPVQTLDSEVKPHTYHVEGGEGNVFQTCPALLLQHYRGLFQTRRLYLLILRGRGAAGPLRGWGGPGRGYLDPHSQQLPTTQKQYSETSCTSAAFGDTVCIHDRLNSHPFQV